MGILLFPENIICFYELNIISVFAFERNTQGAADITDIAVKAPTSCFDLPSLSGPAKSTQLALGQNHTKD